ncbi:unnamed protein product, partial [Iphiclides podalirius]
MPNSQRAHIMQAYESAPKRSSNLNPPPPSLPRPYPCATLCALGRCSRFQARDASNECGLTIDRRKSLGGARGPAPAPP